MSHQRPSGLVIPSNTASVPERIYWCAVCKTVKGEMVGWPAGEERAYQTHVRLCAEENRDALMEHSPQHTAPGIFGDVGVDTELREFYKRTRDY